MEYEDENIKTAKYDFSEDNFELKKIIYGITIIDVY